MTAFVGALLMVLNLTVSIWFDYQWAHILCQYCKNGRTKEIFPNGSIPVLSQFIAWLNLDLV